MITIWQLALKLKKIDRKTKQREFGKYVLLQTEYLLSPQIRKL